LHWVAVAVRIPDDWCNKWLLRLSNNKHNNMHCFYSMYYGLQCENAHCFGGIVKKEWCIGVDSSVEMSMKDWQKCLDRARSLYHKTVKIDPSTHRPIVTSNPWQMKKGPRRPSPLGGSSVLTAEMTLSMAMTLIGFRSCQNGRKLTGVLWYCNHNKYIVGIWNTVCHGTCHKIGEMAH
jgi:hypothetical protein